MKILHLRDGEPCKVDDQDFDYLTQLADWYLMGRYVGATIDGKYQRMHNILLPPNPGYYIDHIDRDPLNNQRSNLRQATNQQNQYNGGMWKHNTTGFKGVYVNKKGWVARIRIWTEGKKKNICLGTYPTKLEAALAYDKAAVELRGEFACTNRMLGLIPEETPGLYYKNGILVGHTGQTITSEDVAKVLNEE